MFYLRSRHNRRLSFLSVYLPAVRPASTATRFCILVPLRYINPSLHIHPQTPASFLESGYLAKNRVTFAFRAMPDAELRSVVRRFGVYPAR